MATSEASALVAEMEAAWNAHDMKRFAACFEDDADFVNVGGWWWRGRDEIEENHTILHNTSFKESQMTLRLCALKELAPGVVVIHVKWQMAGHGKSGVEMTTEARHGIWSWTARDRGGGLRIASAHNTDTLPAPPNHPLAHLTLR